MRSPRLSAAALLVAGAMAVAACGERDDPPPSSAPSGADEPAHGEGAGMQHVHGLGVSRGDLFIATHEGLWRSSEGETTAERVGEEKLDVMGFSIVGDRRFIGSGHPDPSQDQPANLGFFESQDRGETWTGVSLLSQADFHALAAAGSRVYGYDGTQGRLMASADEGQTWREHEPPGGVYSLAVDPQASRRLVASTERGMFVSQDAGASFRSLSGGRGRVGLLAWAKPRRLYLIDATGRVLVTADRGRVWDEVGSAGGPPSAFAADGDDLYAALGDGSIKRSSDGGRTWTMRVPP